MTVQACLALLAQLAPASAADTAVVSALGLGFVLGLRHALDLDHVVAVSTIVSEHRSLARSSLVGAFWGVGHTVSLLLIAGIVIGLRWSISDRVALALELGVALMLIVLGIGVLRRAGGLEVHRHGHEHEPGSDETAGHSHLHVHVAGSGHDHGHLSLRRIRRPLLVGMVHGLAGSAALMLLVLGTIPSPWLGLAYVGIFGLGSIGGMLIMSSLIGLPFLWTEHRFVRLHRGIKLGAGGLSVAFGLFLAWHIGFVEGLLLP